MKISKLEAEVEVDLVEMSSARYILESLAKKTWEDLQDGAELNVSPGEETITDNNVLAVRRSKAPGIHIWKCPKDYESIAGIDYDIFIGSSSLQRWKRYAVQAKKLATDQRNYKKLKHDVPLKTEPPIKVPQLHLLHAYANAVNAIPLYSFYNYAMRSDWENFWRCCQEEIVPDQLGCSVTASINVQEALSKGKTGRRSFDFMHKERVSIPWRCLTCCPALVDDIVSNNSQGDSTLTNSGVQEFKRQCGGRGIYNTIPPEIHRLFDVPKAKVVRPEIKKVSIENEEYTIEVIPKRYFILDIDQQTNFITSLTFK